MRTLPGPPPGEERAFDLPIEGESIRVVIRTPTEREKRILFRQLREAGTVEIDGETVQVWLSEALAKFLVRIEGYLRPTSDGPVPISTVVDLMQYGETSVAETIGAEILAAGSLSEAQKKTLSESSATGSAETRASSGTAESAGESISAALGAATDQPPIPPLSSYRSGGI